MRRLLGFILMAVFLAFPVSAFASYVGTHEMDVDASPLIWGNYYADYDVKVNPLGGITEVFCVENANMIGSNINYDFYTIDNSLTIKDAQGNDISAQWVASLQEATWYANWFVKSSQTEEDKRTAQVAIWNAINFVQDDDANTLLSAYNSANDKDAYTSNWLFAVSPSNQGQGITIPEIGQNYLVAAPVPEPATMVLFGLGLLGLAGVGRKRQKK